MAMTTLDNFVKRPAGYRSNFTDEQKFQAVRFAVEMVERRLKEDQKVVLATLTGSALVGTDTPTSDFDVKLLLKILARASGT